ncbi:MAG TPA: hypothetical protein VJZ72_06650 [Candidatus Limnocylindrales bacterium]|nr:hypothetical protein [Candidatus Limnocylindrales bacterium]
MEPPSLLFWGGGVALIVVGYLRARAPWARYKDLQAQEANVARYEAWRGGLRDEGPTGASVAMVLYRRQARLWGAVAIVGVGLVFVGFLIR